MIEVNGEWWRVKIVPPYHPILTYRTGVPALGCCDDITKTIYLNQTLTWEEMKVVLRHEVVHAVMYSYDENLPDDIEEIVANIIMTYGDEIIHLTNIAYDKLK